VPKVGFVAYVHWSKQLTARNQKFPCWIFLSSVFTLDESCADSLVQFPVKRLRTFLNWRVFWVILLPFSL